MMLVGAKIVQPAVVFPALLPGVVREQLFPVNGY